MGTLFCPGRIPLLGYLLEWITGHPRNRVIAKFTTKSWTHNVFRLYELLFGCRHGIKAEMTAMRSEDGEWYYFPHSFEAHFALLEQYIREYFASWKVIPVRIYIPVLASPNGMPIPASPYLFAIAFDNAANPVNQSTSFTCTGSNLFFSMGIGGNSSSALSTVKYNNVSLTQQVARTMPGFDDHYWYYSLTGPSTGSNTAAITLSAGNANMNTLMSHSGVSQSGQPEATGSATQNGSGNWAVSVTTATANAWVLVNTHSNTGITAVTNVTARTASGGALAGDSNGPIASPGSYTMTLNNSGASDSAAGIVSIAPAITDANISVSDQLNITEAVTMLLISLISVFDQINVTESVSQTDVLNISTSDQLTLTESVTVQTGPFSISVFDQINITESVTVYPETLTLSVADQLNITESVSVALRVDISVSDAISITESVSQVLIMNISVSDQVNVSEAVTMSVQSFINVSDQINITESATKTVSDRPNGLSYMRGQDQNLPVTLTKQDYPLGFNDTSVS